MLIPHKHQLNKFYVESQIVPCSRTWEMELPIGDGFDGPMVGNRDKKAFKAVVNVVKKVAKIAIPVALAVMSGGAFLAALSSGGAFAVLTTGLTAVGSALSAVGSVTGNQKLSKIGNTMALVGGVGMIGQNIANAAGNSLVDKVGNGLNDTFQQLKDGASKAWEGLTGTPVGAQATPVNLEGAVQPTPIADAASGAATSATEAIASAPVQQTGIVGSQMGATNAVANTAVNTAANTTVNSTAPWYSKTWAGITNPNNSALVSTAGNLITGLGTASIMSGGAGSESQALDVARLQAEEEAKKNKAFNESIGYQSSIRVNENPLQYMTTPQANAYAPPPSVVYARKYMPQG